MAPTEQDTTRLQALDAKGYTVVDAVSFPLRDPGDASAEPATYSKPRAFVCVDEKTYWCKNNVAQEGRVQQGLAAELIATRLASKLKVGGPAQIVRVPHELVADKPSHLHLEGVVFGCREHEGMIHVNELPALLSGSKLKPEQIDLGAWASVIAFQSWIGLADGSQMMLSLTSGRMVSLDHGDCFGSLGGDIAVIVNGTLQGHVSGRSDGEDALTVLRSGVLFDAPVTNIESVSREDLLQAVSGIPQLDGWESPRERRLEIVEWLATRQTQIRAAIMSWIGEK